MYIMHDGSGDADDPLDLRGIAPPMRNIDKGELNSFPFLFKVAIVAAAILAGKTQAEARTAVRQAFNILRP